MDYFSELNTNVLLLDNIIDLSNGFTSLNYVYGTEEEFSKFLNYSHKKNIRVFIDFIPNYTTDENEWFKMSVNNTKYKNYYIWSKAPNNWVS